MDGYEITSLGSTTVVATSSYLIQHTAGQTELLYARQTSSGTYEYVPNQGFGTGPSYRWLSNGRSITELAGEGNSESYSSSTTVITSYLSDGRITIQTISDIDADTESLATAKTTTSDRLWQDNYAAGHGRIAAARSSSLPPAGPNLSSSSSYRYQSNLTLTIDPSLFPPPSDSDGSSGSSGTYDQNGGQSNYTPGSGTSGSSTSGSGTSGNPDGSGSSGSDGSTGPTLAEQYQNMQYGVSRWDAADQGFDLTGTVTETSNSRFSHEEQLSQSSEDLMRMDDGRKVGAVQFQASSLEEFSRTSDNQLSVTHGVGRQFSIDTAASEVQANYRWTDKQISSRSEYREYAAPTAAPPTTMATLRANSPSSNQSLLGTAPSGSTLVQESNHSTFYASPLSDVTKTVQHWIAAYESDGGPNAAPILYRYLEQASVNVSAWVEKVGYVFNGSSTLRSKSTFTESDQGTIETYRGLERQEPNSFNHWTVTYAPVETHTGGITQTVTHSKPAADNTITLPGQGTHSTVAPGGEHHAGTSTLATYLTVQGPLHDFVSTLPSFNNYVSLSHESPSDNGVTAAQEAERRDAIINEFKQRYPSEIEYLNRYLKNGDIEFYHMTFYNVDYRGAYDRTARLGGRDIIYFDPDTNITYAADLLLEYLHVMQHYGNSKFSSEMDPKVGATVFLDNLQAAGVQMAAGTRPYRVGMADLKQYNNMGLLVANLMPVVGTSISVAEAWSGKSLAFTTQFVDDISPTQRFVLIATTVGGPVVAAVAYKVGGKIYLRIIGQADTIDDARKLAPKSAFLRGLPKGEEVFDTAVDYVEARVKASNLAGLTHCEQLVDFVSDVGPQFGKVLGKQSPDKLRGWRLDWHPETGFHINWWDHTANPKNRAEWYYGAVQVPGKSWQDYIDLIQHGVTF